jgi:hypothetical protein
MGRLEAMLAIAIGAILVGLPTPGAADTILTCVFASGTASFYEGGTAGKRIEVDLDRKESPWTVIFTGLDGDRPRFKGNLGEETLSS